MRTVFSGGAVIVDAHTEMPSGFVVDDGVITDVGDAGAAPDIISSADRIVDATGHLFLSMLLCVNSTTQGLDGNGVPPLVESVARQRSRPSDSCLPNTAAGSAATWPTTGSTSMRAARRPRPAPDPRLLSPGGREVPYFLAYRLVGSRTQLVQCLGRPRRAQTQRRIERHAGDLPDDALEMAWRGGARAVGREGRRGSGHLADVRGGWVDGTEVVRDSKVLTADRHDIHRELRTRRASRVDLNDMAVPT